MLQRATDAGYVGKGAGTRKRSVRNRVRPAPISLLMARARKETLLARALHAHGDGVTTGHAVAPLVVQLMRPFGGARTAGLMGVFAVM